MTSSLEDIASEAAIMTDQVATCQHSLHGVIGFGRCRGYAKIAKTGAEDEIMGSI